MVFLIRNRGRKGYLDEFGGSGRVNYGLIGLAPHDIFGRYCYLIDSYRGYPPHLGNDLHLLMLYGIGITCQDVINRSWICPPFGSTPRRTTEGVTLSQYVWTMSNVQTSHEPSLSYMQPMRLKDGPSLSLDEQLCRCGQFKALHTIPVVHMDLCGILSGNIWLELLLLCR